MKHPNNENDVLILKEGAGRKYTCGPMTAIFKADESETGERYSISEWWLEPRSEGPAPHMHEETDQVFYVLEGVVSMFIGDSWMDAGKGTFIRIARRTMHTFANRTTAPAAFLNVDIPGGFEKELPAMVQWFDDKK